MLAPTYVTVSNIAHILLRQRELFLLLSGPVENGQKYQDEHDGC